MTRPSDHYPRRCGCGHHAADPLDTITLGPGRVIPLDEVIRQIVNDHPISLRDDLDGLTKTVQPRDIRVKLSADSLTPDEVQAVRQLLALFEAFHDASELSLGSVLPEHCHHALPEGVSLVEDDSSRRVLGQEEEAVVTRNHDLPRLPRFVKSFEDVTRLLESLTDDAMDLVPEGKHDGGHVDSSTGQDDAATSPAPTVEADTPTRAGIGVEDATTPAPSTSDDIVSVSISLTGDRELVELVAALVIGGAS